MLNSVHIVKDFSASHTVLPVERLGVHRKLGGDTTRTAGLDWTKGYSILFGVMLNSKTEGIVWGLVGYAA